MLKKIALGICFLFCLGYFSSNIFADTVVLKSGQVIEGKIIENNVKFVKIVFEGVGLVFLQEEIALINQGGVENVVNNDLSSLYAAFQASKNVVKKEDLPAEPVEPSIPMVNPEVQDAQVMGGSGASLASKTLENVGSSDAVQAALAQLPKEYQEMVKAQLKNMQIPGSQGQVPGATTEKKN